MIVGSNSWVKKNLTHETQLAQNSILGIVLAQIVGGLKHENSHQIITMKASKRQDPLSRRRISCIIVLAEFQIP